MTRNSQRQDHLSAEIISAYLDDALGAEERVSVLRHLSACDDCRAEVVEVRRVLKSRPGLGRWTGLGLVAAAAVMLIALPLAWGGLSRTETFRSGPGPLLDGSQTIEVVSPADGSVDASVGLGFVWHAVPGGLRYEVTLSDEAGEVLWSGATSDTAIALPSTVALEVGDRLFWFVDALTEDGEAVSSGIREITLR